jgi:hypothetical protein
MHMMYGEGKPSGLRDVRNGISIRVIKIQSTGHNDDRAIVVFHHIGHAIID